MKTLIYGGTVYDGTGGAPYGADVLVENGRIAAVEAGLAARDIDVERIDARGRIVTPGLIDMHRHCDVAPFRDPDFGLLELSQGITATTVGNCGIACVPVPPERYAEYGGFIAPVVGGYAPRMCLCRLRRVLCRAGGSPARHPHGGHGRHGRGEGGRQGLCRYALYDGRNGKGAGPCGRGHGAGRAGRVAGLYVPAGVLHHAGGGSACDRARRQSRRGADHAYPGRG